MKSTWILGLSVLVFSCSNAQDKKNDSDAPKAVKEAFAKKYPNAKVDSWEKEDVGYEAEFKMNKIESSAVFSDEGVFLEVEQEIKPTELPQSVRDYCAKEYKGYKLAEAAKITDAANKVMFEAEMGNGKEHFDVLFDDKGNFVKKLATAKESEEDED